MTPINIIYNKESPPPIREDVAKHANFLKKSVGKFAVMGKGGIFASAFGKYRGRDKIAIFERLTDKQTRSSTRDTSKRETSIPPGGDAG